MTQVTVDDHAQTLELVKVPVDGGQVDVRRLLLHQDGQFFSGVVLIGVEESTEKQAPRLRHPATLLSHEVQHTLDGGGISRSGNHRTHRFAHARILRRTSSTLAWSGRREAGRPTYPATQSQPIPYCK